MKNYLGLCIWFFVCLPVAGQQAITLDIAITDKGGQLIPGLQHDDFPVWDNGVPRQLEFFRAVSGAVADLPVQAVIVIDEVNAGFSAVAYERKQLETFLLQSGGHLPLPATLVFFTDTGVKIGPTPSANGNQLVAEMNAEKNPQRTIGRSQGFYGAQERIQLSIRTLGQIANYLNGRTGRKLVIWISPGWPLLSGPRVDLTEKSQAEIFRNIVALSDSLRAARITLDLVDPLGTADSIRGQTQYYKEFTKGATDARQVKFGNLGLPVLAYQSGGRVLNSSNDISGEIATCFSDAGAFYVATFKAPPADGPNEYHQIEVKVNKPGLSARTRTGYYNQPQTTGKP